MGCLLPLPYGVDRENIAEALKLSREDLDQFALESQQKAARAIEAAVFNQEIVLVEVPGRKGPTIFTQDQQPRSDTTMEERC